MSRLRVVMWAALVCAVALTSPSVFAQDDPWTARDNESVAPASPAGLPTFDIVFTPDDAPHAVCPPFGSCPPADQITDEYIGFGVDFTAFDGNAPIGVFTDPPDKFAGVNAQGNLDLLTDTCARIVATGSQTQATTDLVIIEAGLVSGASAIELQVYDLGGSLIDSAIADQGTGVDGDVIAVVQASGIASFCVTTPTNDSYGLRRIYLNDPGAAAPTMGSAALLALGLLLALTGALYLRRRQTI